MKNGPQKAPPDSALLEIIRGEKRKNVSTPRFLSRFRAEWNARIAVFFRRQFEAPWGALERFFVLLVSLTLVWGVATVLKPVGQLEGDGFFGRVVEKNEEKRETDSLSLGYYTSVIKKKNLFRTIRVKPPKPKVVPVPKKPEVKKPSLSELAANLKLMGVINSGEVQAIILEKRMQRTYYVTTGEKVGEITVLKITEDHVTLSYEGETMDLFL